MLSYLTVLSKTSLPQQRRAREKENLRRAILDAARELFVEEDFKNVSIRRIADKIEYSPTAIYLYFKDKNEIFFELMKEGDEHLSMRLEATRSSDPLQALRAGARAYLDFAVEEPHYYKIMFWAEDQATGEFGCEHLEAICGRSFSFLITTITDVIEKGIYRGPMSVTLLGHVLWAWWHGAAMLVLGQRLKFLPDGEKESYLQTVIDNSIQFIQSAK